jgi:hypothetical protein
LYERAEHLKSSLSEGTDLWSDYFDAVGSKLIDAKAATPRPLSFAGFCECYFLDSQLRKFYDQLHMFIWLLADGKNSPHVDKTRDALFKLMTSGFFLEALPFPSVGSNPRRRSWCRPSFFLPKDDPQVL